MKDKVEDILNLFAENKDVRLINQEVIHNVIVVLRGLKLLSKSHDYILQYMAIYNII